MRDRHAGIGGELASMLALADAPAPRTQEIARHARAALTDMRLIIGSLEDYGGDLSLALVAWRERAEPQLRAAGLRLVWSVDDVPPLEKFGPAQVLDVRSEEHTSELQSLMRISYAVFCLKKKKHTQENKKQLNTQATSYEN